MIKINIDKAKHIHKESLRYARTPVLEDLDKKFMKALENGEDPKDIVAMKQELRDITEHPDLVNAKTLDQIKAFWPDILNSK